MNSNLLALLSCIGLAAGIVAALKISRQGGLSVKRLWIMPTVMWVAAAMSYQFFGVTPVSVTATVIASLVGAAMGAIQARLAIREIDVQRKLIVTKSGLKTFVIGLAIMAVLQLMIAQSGGFDAKSFAKLGVVMGLLSISTEKLSYLLAYLRARQAAAVSNESINT